jgi:hypothetical protein
VSGTDQLEVTVAARISMQPELEPEPEPEPQLLAPLRCRIDSDAAAMQALHELHGWVPGERNIRPNEDVLEEKKAYPL